MIINDLALIQHQPIIGMLETKELANGVSHGLAEAGYDIRIKQSVSFWPTKYHISGSPLSGPTHWIQTPPMRGGPIQKGNFCLASAIEEFDMPANLAGIVHDKSTWARQGLSVFNTVIEPGWKGFLTLELVYHGSDPLHIPAGSGIAQVLFHELKVPRHYNGKYANQADMPVPAIMEPI